MYFFSTGFYLKDLSLKKKNIAIVHDSGEICKNIRESLGEITPALFLNKF